MCTLLSASWFTWVGSIWFVVAVGLTLNPHGTSTSHWAPLMFEFDVGVVPPLTNDIAVPTDVHRVGRFAHAAK